MTWSINKTGKPKAVAAQIAAELEVNTLAEPEQTVRHHVGLLVAAALGAMPEGSAVTISASGSQNSPDYSDLSKGASNYVKLEITPIYGFVE